MKKETLEEAVERYLNNGKPQNAYSLFIEGAKWQQEQSKKMKQTPIEWLYNKMFEHKGNITISEFQKAKEMEQAQRRKDFIAGNECACMCHENIDDYFNQYID